MKRYKLHLHIVSSGSEQHRLWHILYLVLAGGSLGLALLLPQAWLPLGQIGGFVLISGLALWRQRLTPYPVLINEASLWDRFLYHPSTAGGPALLAGIIAVLREFAYLTGR